MQFKNLGFVKLRFLKILNQYQVLLGKLIYKPFEIISFIHILP
jgi:hypothetical protein